MTHTEKVHILFGLGLVLLGLLALHAAWRPSSWTRHAWPAIAFLIGALLFVPVEAGTRTYEEVGWLETWRTWAPEHAATWLPDWLAAAAAPHAMQHKVAGALTMALGILALLRAGAGLAPKWDRLMPVLMVGIAVSLGVHGGNAAHLPSFTEQAHHWILGTGLGGAGLLCWLTQRGTLATPAWRYGWPALVTLTGLDLVLFYRLAAGTAGHGGH